MELPFSEMETSMGEGDLRVESRSLVYTLYGAMCLRHWWAWPSS